MDPDAVSTLWSDCVLAEANDAAFIPCDALEVCMDMDDQAPPQVCLFRGIDLADHSVTSWHPDVYASMV